MNKFLSLAALLLLSFHLGAEEMKSVAAAPLKSAPAEWTVRELRYEGRLADKEARFAVGLDLESTGKGEAVVPLFEGEVAILPVKLPNNLRLVRERNQYRLIVAKPGRYQFQLDLIAKISRADPWNQISFVGPAAAIASITAVAEGREMEVQLLSGTVAENAAAAVAPVEARGLDRVRGYLGSDHTVALRWQSRKVEETRQALLTCETTAGALVTPTVVKYTTALHYEILQGRLSRLAVSLPVAQAITRLQGEQIRDWQVKPDGEQQLLTIEFIKAVEQTYSLTIFSEQAVEGAGAQLFPPQPQAVERETGSLTVTTEDTLAETDSVIGLRQVNAPAGALAAYQFSGRQAFALGLKLRRIEPVITTTDRVSARLEETRLLVTHALGVTVEKAGIYTLELTPPPGFIVSEVHGEGVDDWKLKAGKLLVSFGRRLLGARNLEIQLEQALKTFPDEVTVLPLRVAVAAKETAQVGAAAAAGIQLKTAGLNGVREVPAALRAGESLAYTADQPDWSLKLSAEKQSARIVAEIFNLITVGDGLLGGSATIRYAILNQGVQEFKVRLPVAWKNVEFTGPTIRRKEPVVPVPGQPGDTNSVVWIISLQDKAWGGYPLVVTYDAQFDPRQATLPVGGAHALGVERESGTVAVTAAANVQLNVKTASDALRRVDESELSAADRSLITRPVLQAFQYEGDKYDLAMDVMRFAELPVLEAVADRTQITTVLTEEGQMLTQASFMVKNNDKQFQRFTLPKEAKFWGAYVNNEPVKAEQDAGALLVPLPRGTNRDEAFAVDIVYAQKIGALKSFKSRAITLEAPKTDVPNTYNEWELYVPPTHRLAEFGGNMIVQRGTSYELRDAWQSFLGFYQQHYEETVQVSLAAAAIFLGLLLLTAAWRRGWRGALTALGVCGVFAVLAGMMLPALSKARAKSGYAFRPAELPPVELAATLNAPASALTTSEPAKVEPGKPPSPFPMRMTRMPGKELAVVDDGRKREAAGDKLKAVDQLRRKDGDDATATPLTGRLFRSETASSQLSREAQAKATEDKHGVAIARMVAASPITTPEPKLPVPALVNAGGAAGIPAAPVVSGIRPVHIDIPRTGERFVFTKVLNLQGEPLTISTLAMEAQAYRLTQAGRQFFAFVFGALFFWWQWRRTKRSSFLLALGLALMLAAIGSLLLTERLLHLAFIALVPLALGGFFLWLLVRFGKRRARTRVMPVRETGESGLASGGGSSIPLTPLVICSLFLAVGAQAMAKPAPQDTNSVAIVSASYGMTLREQAALVEAGLEINTSRPGQKVVLFGEDIAVQEFFCTQKEARLVRDGKSVSVILPRKGSVSLTLKFLVKHTGEAAKRQLGFGIPPALTSRLSATLGEAEATVEVPTAVNFKTTSAGSQTKVEAILGAAERIELVWTPRVKRTEEITATIFVQSATVQTVAGGMMNTRSVFDYQVTQGELRQARLRLPAGQKLMRVEADSLRTWKLAGEKDGPVLLVEMAKGVSPNWRLTVELEQMLPALPATVKLEAPRALDVKRETGLVALKAGDDLSLSVETAKELQKVDTTEFDRSIAPKVDGLTGAYRFLRPEFELVARVENVRPQIEAVVQNVFHIGTEQLLVNGSVDFTIKHAGIFTLRVALPKDFRVESVQGGKISQWIERKEAGVLEVTLKERVLGAYNLRVGLVRTVKELPKTLELAGVHPLDTQKLSGHVAVSAEEGVQVKADSFAELSEIPAVTLPRDLGLAAGAGTLAYKFMATEPGALPAWKLTVTTEKVDSWVRAEVVSWVTVRDTLVSGRTVVRYEIANAPAREFQLRVPGEFKNVEITGADIRRRDQNGDVWRVELQNKKKGVYLLAVTWEQPWNVKERRLPVLGIAVQGVDAKVERETGSLVFLARAPLQVAENAASADLTRLDPHELPDWAGHAAETPALAYRYLRPGYQLSLNAQRFTEAEVLQAIADSARLTSVVSEDGRMMTQLELAVRNNGRQFLEVALPGRNDKVWSAFVAGQAVKPTLRDGKVLLPLERSGAEEAAIMVELTYVSTEKFPKDRGNVTLTSPKLDVPLANVRWELFLPPAHAYSRFAGTMARMADEPPVYAAFTSAFYSKSEQEKKVVREAEVSSSLSNARSYLAGGNIKGASKLLSGDRNIGEGDSGANAENYRQLEKQVLLSQARQLMDAQGAVTLNFYSANRAVLPSSGEAAKTLAYDAEVAERQAVKLQQAQEIVVSKVRPLHVNLPQRGLHFSFGQALQTEVGRAMTVSFSVADTQAVNWPARTAAGLAGFLLLWALVAATQRKTAAV